MKKLGKVIQTVVDYLVADSHVGFAHIVLMVEICPFPSVREG